MGKHFLMSMRFNKSSPEDFGLVKINGKVVNPCDKSEWERMELYDFGWGKENGYVKLPVPVFSELINIVSYSRDKEDMYGAAALILDLYTDDLLHFCESTFIDKDKIKSYKQMIEILSLRECVNRCSTVGKTCEEIISDYSRWKQIADILNG